MFFYYLQLSEYGKLQIWTAESLGVQKTYLFYLSIRSVVFLKWDKFFSGAENTLFWRRKYSFLAIEFSFQLKNFSFTYNILILMRMCVYWCEIILYFPNLIKLATHYFYMIKNTNKFPNLLDIIGTIHLYFNSFRRNLF